MAVNRELTERTLLECYRRVERLYADLLREQDRATARRDTEARAQIATALLQGRHILGDPALVLLVLTDAIRREILTNATFAESRAEMLATLSDSTPAALREISELLIWDEKTTDDGRRAALRLLSLLAEDV